MRYPIHALFYLITALFLHLTLASPLSQSVNSVLHNRLLLRADPPPALGDKCNGEIYRCSPPELRQVWFCNAIDQWELQETCYEYDKCLPKGDSPHPWADAACYTKDRDSKFTIENIPDPKNTTSAMHRRSGECMSVSPVMSRYSPEYTDEGHCGPNTTWQFFAHCSDFNNPANNEYHRCVDQSDNPKLGISRYHGACDLMHLPEE